MTILFHISLIYQKSMLNSIKTGVFKGVISKKTLQASKKQWTYERVGNVKAYVG